MTIRRGTTIRKLSALLILIVLTATACAKGAPGKGRSAARDAVLDALSTPAELLGDTARYRMTVTAVADSTKRVLYEASGVADFKQNRWLGTVSDDSFNGAPGKQEDFGIDAFVYKRFGESGKWSRTSLDWGGVGSPFPDRPMIGNRYYGGNDGPSYAADRDARRQIFDAAVIDVEPKGISTLFGAEVRKYSVSMGNEKQIRAKLPKKLASEVGAWDEYRFLGDVDVWVDGEHRLRRIATKPKASSFGFVSQEEWWDFGEAPSVDIPEGVDEKGSGKTSVKVTNETRKPGTIKTDTFRIERGGSGFNISVLNVGEISVRTVERKGSSQVTRYLRIEGLTDFSVPQIIPLGKRFNVPPPGAQPQMSLRDPGAVFYFGDDSVPRCETRESGKLTLNELELDDSHVLHLRASFEITCQMDSGAVRITTGDIRYRSLT